MDETIMGEVFHNHTAAIAVCFILAVLCMFGAADAAQQEAELFEKAYEYYLSYNPEKAAETFDLFIRQFPESSALDSAMFWRAKSFVHLKKYDEAARGFQTMMDLYPVSSYVVYADKELESLRKMPRTSEPYRAVTDLPVLPIDTKAAPVEEKVRNLEREKHDLEMRLSDAEQNRQLTERNLAKVLEDKSVLVTELEALKKREEGLANKRSVTEKSEKDNARLSEEKKSLETRLRESEETVKGLQAEREKTQEELAVLKNELSGNSQDSRKVRGQHDEYVKQLTAEKAALQQTIHQKEREMSEFQQRLASLEKKTADTEAARQKEKEDANTALVQMSAEKTSLEKELSQEKKRRTDLENQGMQREDVLRQLQASEEKRKQYEQEMTRLTAERDALLTKAAEREQAERDKKDLLSRIEAVSKERDDLAKQAALQDKAAQDKRQVETEAQQLRAETDVLQKKVKELEAVEKERITLQAEILERDQKLATASETIASLRGAVQSLEQEKGKTLTDLQEKQRRAEADKIAREEELKKEQRNIAARLEEQQKKGKEQEATINKMSTEKAGLEKEILSNREKLAELKAVQEENIRLNNENSQIKTAKSQAEQEIKKTSEEKALLEQREGREASETKKVRDELVEAKKTADLQAKKSQELQQEIMTLRTQLQEYEQPVIRIGKDRYSLIQVINEAKLSARVKQKIKAAPAPWARSSAIETVIAEETLYRKAREAGIKDNRTEQDALAQQYRLDAKEREYLAKYLVIDSLYRGKSAELSVSEKEIREYYEQHREEFIVSPARKTVRTLALNHTGADELEKSLIAVELHREALGGKKLEEIANKHRGVAFFREMPFESVPEWVREKLEQLRDGEVSTIISSDTEFMIMQMQHQQSAYKSYNDVRSDIEKKLALDREKRRLTVEQWLTDIAGDAEIIR
jgi:chromosome segregation ATPase